MKRLLILAAAAVALCGLAGTAYAAHGWGTGGDSSFAQTTIYDLEQYGTLTGNALLTGHPVVGDTLKFTGKIVTAIDAKSTTYGMWIEEPAGGPWSGLMVYCGGDNPVAPPSGPVMRVGDIVTVQGLYAEYSNIAGVNTVTELNCGKGASPAYMTYGFCIQITGHTTPPPPQRLVTANLRVSDTGCVEKWEGVLCELDSVFVTPYSGTFAGQCLVRQMDSSYWQAPNSPPACWTGGGLDTCRLNPKVISPNPTWTPGSQIRTVIGFVCQEYQWYYLAPRDLTNDVQYIGQTPPPNLTRAFTPDNTHVVATFDKKMDPTTAKNPGYYSMLHSTLSTTGTLSSDSLSVTFVTDAPMTGGTAETLYVAGVKGVPPNGTTMVGTQKRGFRAGFTPITLIQTPGVHHDSSAIVNEWITLQGVVTAGSATYKSGGAVFVEDPAGGTYSGVETYSPVASVAVGDNITVAGQVQEYNGKTEIGAIFYTVVNSSGNSLPAPAAVTIGQINGKAAPATAEMYEGMWVTTTGTVASDT
ncbi:MAG TPA: hypothetical protein VMS93_06800, partial [Candidatus Saccharimonadales bacterium]|nr:hypothetical protein [Candidatus Saccharimonadales bacterium]